MHFAEKTHRWAKSEVESLWGLWFLSPGLPTTDPERREGWRAGPRGLFLSAKPQQETTRSRGQPWPTTGPGSQEGPWGRQCWGFRFLTGSLHHSPGARGGPAEQG